MYSFMLTVHSLLRWAVLILGVLATFRAVAALSSRKPWTRPDHVTGALFVASLDLQVLIGAVLYVFLSPITGAAMRNFGSAMANRPIRFWAVEHVSLMLAAAVLAHLGRARIRRALGDANRHKQAAIFFALALLALLLGIPWPFLPYGRPLF